MVCPVGLNDGFNDIPLTFICARIAINDEIAKIYLDVDLSLLDSFELRVKAA